LRKCTKEDFATVDTVVVGAEKLPHELSDSFEKRFGIRPVEGYGATELSPLVSVNVPASRTPENFQADAKEGSVGRTVPNVAAKVTDVNDSSRILGANAEGLLWIKGPNVMLGYLNRPDLTAEVIVDGWYCTGDMAKIDEEGFITLTGRMSRFSKIGGEMVPHIQIEEALTSILNEKNYDEQKIAVTAVPDKTRGERLVVLHTDIENSPGDLCRRLRESGLPNLYIPSEDSFFKVDAIPFLGSGKLDLKRMKEVALEVVGRS
jgi:acyl-[acyl-carrier-protein]-phospholipid O-acyltransferase/long-chain-fatty-acid--[acyl-carrier-protein] ligase